MTDTDQANQSSKLLKFITWSKDWQLIISRSKCAVLKINKKFAGSVMYKIDCTELPVVQPMKDLFVLIDPALRFTDAIATTVSKTKSRSNFILKCFHQETVHPSESTNDLFTSTYGIRDRRVLAVVHWRLQKIEIGAKKFNKKESGLKQLPYSERLQILCLHSLELRSWRHDLQGWSTRLSLALFICDIANLFEFKSLTSRNIGHPYHAEHEPQDFKQIADLFITEWLNHKRVSLQVLTSVVLLHLNTIRSIDPSVF